MNNRGGGSECLGSPTKYGMNLAQLISSGSQRDTAWVRGEGSQRLGRRRPSLGASHTKACTTLLAWLFQSSRNSTQGFDLGSLFFWAKQDGNEKQHNIQVFLEGLRNPHEEQDKLEWPNSFTLQSPEGPGLPWALDVYGSRWKNSVGSGVRKIRVQISLFPRASCVNSGEWCNLSSSFNILFFFGKMAWFLDYYRN